MAEQKKERQRQRDTERERKENGGDREREKEDGCRSHRGAKEQWNSTRRGRLLIEKVRTSCLGEGVN